MVDRRENAATVMAAEEIFMLMVELGLVARLYSSMLVAGAGYLVIDVEG